MSLGRYSILVIGTVVVTLGVAWPLALRGLDAPARWAVAFGGAVAVLNTTAAYGIVRWSVRHSTTAFLGALLGGMVGRMALMLIALGVGIVALRLPQLPLAAALLGYFLLFLMIEIAIVHRQTSLPPGVTR